MSAARSRRRTVAGEIAIIGLRTLPEVKPGDDLAVLISAALRRENRELRSGDILVVAQKVVSKAEGRVERLRAVKPSELARRWARTLRDDPRFVEVVLRESRRVIRMTERALIVETRHGFICANAGVDRSNVRDAGTVMCLPLDPDRSARTAERPLAEDDQGACRRDYFRYVRTAVAAGTYECGHRRSRIGGTRGFARHTRREWAQVARYDPCRRR